MKKLVVGIDEVGRGPLAGPVVAAAVAFPADYTDDRIRDSKKLSARNREKLSPIIQSTCAAWAVVAVGHHRIEQLNIRGASLLAMRLALERIRKVKVETARVLVDGNTLIELPPSWTGIPQEAVVGGDNQIMAIGAASIVAKVWRDKLMRVLGERYPGYGLEKHAGYPTPTHRQAIAKLGVSRIHRRSFQGVREYWGQSVGNALPSYPTATS